MTKTILTELAAMPTVINNHHESLARAWNILEHVKAWLADDVPADTILLMIDTVKAIARKANDGMSGPSVEISHGRFSGEFDIPPLRMCPCHLQGVHDDRDDKDESGCTCDAVSIEEAFADVERRIAEIFGRTFGPQTTWLVCESDDEAENASFEALVDIVNDYAKPHIERVVGGIVTVPANPEKLALLHDVVKLVRAAIELNEMYRETRVMSSLGKMQIELMPSLEKLDDAVRQFEASNANGNGAS